MKISLYDRLVALSPSQYSGILLTIAATSAGFIAATAVATIFLFINLKFEKKRFEDWQKEKGLIR